VLPFPADRPPQPSSLGSSLDRLNHFLSAKTVRHAWLGTGAMATYAPITAPIAAPIAQNPIAQNPIARSAWIAIVWIQPESVARLRIHAEAEHWQVSAVAHPLGSGLTLIDTLSDTSVDPATTTQFILIPVSDCHLIADPGRQGDRPTASVWPDYAWAVLKRREVLKRSQLGSAEDGESVPMWIATPEDLLLVRLLERRGDRSDPGGTAAIQSALGDWWRSLGEQLDGQQSNAQHPDGQQSNGQHPDGQHPDGQQSNGQHPDGQHPDGQQSNGQHPDGQQSNDQQSNDQQSNDQQSNDQHSDDQHSDGQPSNNQRRLNVCYVQEWSDRLGVATLCDQILLSR
jgi:hypothetical protein